MQIIRGGRASDKIRQRNTVNVQLVIGAFIAFASLTIVIITQLKVYNFNIIYILLIIMLIVLVLGFWGKSTYQILKDYSEKRKHDKLAKSHFEDFKKLVLRFRDFTENRLDNIQSVTGYIKNDPAFSQISVVWPTFIQERYKYYNESLNKFDGTKDGLVSLVKEFESIVSMYYELYVNEPVKSIRNIGRDKVPQQHKESYNKARIKYMDFITDYIKFAKIANEDFKEKEESYGLGGSGLLRDFFDLPEEL